MEPYEIIAQYEGLTIEEAKLTYKQRQDLPESAFCGPDRSYPAHDAAHVRNAFARLSAFGKRLPRATAQKIYRCLVRRAKRFGIEHDPEKFKWLTGKSVRETIEEDDKYGKKLIEWYLNELLK